MLEEIQSSIYVAGIVYTSGALALRQVWGIEKISFVRPAQLPQGLSILFQLAWQSTEMNLKFLVLLSWWCHRTGRWLHWRCHCSYWISLEGFSWTSTNTHKQSISLVNRGKVFKAVVRSVLLYASETWPLSTEDLSRIKRCDHAMIRWLSTLLKI